MRKVKNPELKESCSSLKLSKEGKIMRKKFTAKKIKGAVNKTVDLKLPPKNQGSNYGSDEGYKTQSKEIKSESESDLHKIAKNDNGKLAEQRKEKEFKNIKNKLPEKIPSEEKTKTELKKIEKKKAKKLAQKLKKQLNKAQKRSFANTTTKTLNSEEKGKNSSGQKVKNIKKGANEDLYKKHNPIVNGGNNNIDAISSEVLKKKAKNAIKGQLLRHQKLETAEIKSVNATSGEVLAKKDIKATKRQLLEDQKLKTAENKTDKATSSEVLNKDATSTKVLLKKENKALKRQLVKDQKLIEKQSRDPAVEEATVFVGNLPVNTKRVQLQHIFKKFGPVNFIRLRSAGGKILHKHKQRRLAGSLNAYVVLQSKEKAEKSISLNGIEFKGNHLRVTLATQKPESHDNGEAKRTVFIGNLKYSASEESLREIFSSCGEIEYVRCIRDGDRGCKGVAYVCFKTADAVGLALELNETIVDERSIHVERFNVKKLGAKKEREAQAEKEFKSKTGAKLRLEGKKNKKEKSSNKLPIRAETDAKMSKKSEFRGVKVEGLKRKQKPKKKKSNNSMLQMAKKIAPKSKI